MLFIKKVVSKDITLRTRIRNNFPKDRSKENKKTVQNNPIFASYF